ncbi:MAG: HAD-IA family hydrolase [Methylophilaceae bacterium]|nr:HAD-IA family hydrolase [Methylophilaceae bacterium]
MRKKYKVIIFDWDGTIVNSTGLIVKAIKEAALVKGITLIDERKISSVIGLGLDQAFRVLFNNTSMQEIIELQELYKDFYLENINKVSLFDGIVPGIKDLHRRGYNLAIATGKSRRGLDIDLKQSGLEPLFNITKTMDECFSKPHPQMVNEILDFYIIEKNEALIVGDSTYDLEMALNAGIDSLGVTFGSHNKAELLNYNPKAIVDNAYEIFEWIMRNE